MTRGRAKRLSPDFKARVALEAAKGHKTASEIAQEFQVHPTQISQWKRQWLDTVPELFESTAARARRTPSAEEIAAPLYEEIGRLKVELDFLKKVCAAQGVGRWLIEPEPSELSIRRQCDLIGLPRLQYYYTPSSETPENLALMCLIDKQYLRTPFFGSRQMNHWLQRQGYRFNCKRIQRLMQLTALQAIAPGPHTRRPHPEHMVYPYRLRGLAIEHSCQAWCADITYIPMRRGFMYLMAVFD